MRPVGASLSTYLDTHTATPPIRHLVTLTPSGASAVRWTDHERDIQLVRPAYPGDPEGAGTYTFLHGGEGTTEPLVKVGRSKRGHGTEEIDKCALALLCANAPTYGVMPWQMFAASKGLDGAVVKVERLYIPDSGAMTSLGTAHWFEGLVGTVKVSSLEIEFDVETGIGFLAATQLPRRVFEAGCSWMLYDAACTVNKAANTYACTANAGATTTVLATSTALAAPTQATGYFQLGVLTFTSGALNGYKRGVRIDSFAAGVHTFTVDRALPSAPAAGDAFSIYPGCDKQQATCTNKFSNLVHFGGVPYVPRGEVA